MDKQRAFKKSAGILVKEGIIDLDKEIIDRDEKLVSLREVVETYQRKGSDDPLFMRCERLRGRDGQDGQHGFAVTPLNYDVAKDFLNNLVSYCR